MKPSGSETHPGQPFTLLLLVRFDILRFYIINVMFRFDKFREVRIQHCIETSEGPA